MATDETPQENPDNIMVILEEDIPRRPNLPSQPLNITEDSDDLHLIINMRRQQRYIKML
jgi:hypothetical protein